MRSSLRFQDYALWEVIENGNSWVPIPVTAPESGPSTALKMTVPSTAEEKICKKNDLDLEGMKQQRGLKRHYSSNSMKTSSFKLRITCILSILGFQKLALRARKFYQKKTGRRSSLMEAVLMDMINLRTNTFRPDLIQVDKDWKEKFSVLLIKLGRRPNGICSRQWYRNIAHLSDFKTLMEVMLLLFRGANRRQNYWQGRSCCGCDKKNYVLFTDSEFLVLSPNFKLIEVNTGSRDVSTVVPEVNTITPEDLVGPSPTSEDSHVENQEIELGNIPQSYEVPTNSLTQIHKDYHNPMSMVEVMQEELLQFKLQKVWILMDLPKVHRAIGTKWVYRNKKDERGFIIRNKARLVAQGHTQEEGVDYNEVFAPVARIEAIRLFLAYASYMGFMVYQMDVKSAFLYGQIEEEDLDCNLTASRPDIMFVVCACARFQVSPKTSHLLAVKRIFRYLKGKPSLGLWYSKDSPLELVAYTDSDYAGATLDKKSTIGVATSTTEAEYVAAASFCGQHNMVAFLEKSTGSAGFHQIIDFLNRSHICYALTKKPDVCVSFIKQFWRSAEVTTAENGEVKITATIDGHSMTITEGSLRRHLKLDDQDGISSIPNSEIFEQLALMGYHTDSDKLTFQKGTFLTLNGVSIPLILHCLAKEDCLGAV
ncbi:uncharacterized mitochondrial protein-like protein [Tanacetum coccineum]